MQTIRRFGNDKFSLEYNENTNKVIYLTVGYVDPKDLFTAVEEFKKWLNDLDDWADKQGAKNA